MNSLSLSFDLSRLLELAKQASIRAGEAIMAEYESFEAGEEMLKSDNSPLTKADLASNEIIFELLSPAGLAICSEESVDSFKPFGDSFWLVDPLDGTKEFIAKNGEFCVCIALIKSGQPLLGVIYAPVNKELFFASKDGVFKNKSGVLTRLDTPLNPPLAKQNSLYLSAREAGARELDFARHTGLSPFKLGSALKFTHMLQYGGVYLRLSPSRLWDNAAGVALLRFMGGDVYNLDGTKLSFEAKNGFKSPNFIALSKDFVPRLEQFLKALASV